MKYFLDLLESFKPIIYLLIIGLFIIWLIKISPWQLSAASLTLITAFVAYYSNLQVQYRNEQKENKAEAYEQVISLLSDIILNIVHNKNVNNQEDSTSLAETEMAKKMVIITSKLLLWGSDDVVLVYNQLRKTSLNPPSDDVQKTGFELLKIYNKLLLNIRKDLGHNNYGIDSEGFLIALFLSDQPKSN